MNDSILEKHSEWIKDRLVDICRKEGEPLLSIKIPALMLSIAIKVAVEGKTWRTFFFIAKTINMLHDKINDVDVPIEEVVKWG